MNPLALVATGRRRRGRHRGHDLIGAGEGEIFGRVIGRQDLDHRLVLDPNLDDMKRAAVADKAFPAGTGRDLLDLLRIGRNAEGKMGRPVTAFTRLLDEVAADLAVRLEFRASRTSTPDPCSSSCKAKKLPGLGGNGTAVPPINSANTPAACLGSRAAIER